MLSASASAVGVLAVTWLVAGWGSTGMDPTSSFPSSAVVATLGTAASPPQHTPMPTPAQSAKASTEPALSPAPAATAQPGPTQGSRARHFPGGLLIADRLNGRLIVVNDAGALTWQFPDPGSLPPGETFSADDAFIAPDGKTIVANEEDNQVIVRIDIATKKVIWEYGTFGVHGSGPNQLWTPDDAYPLANGDITTADIRNCRVLEIAPDKHIVREWGVAGSCSHNPPGRFSLPNGDTPLPDGGMLITEITGSRVVRLSAAGDVVFDVVVPVHYPSDAQLLPNGNILVVDYAKPGAVLIFDPNAKKVVYRYGPRMGLGRLVHPSLAIPLPDGTIALNDDGRHRVLVIDPATSSIVWSYGHADHPSSAPGYLDYPDGIDLMPAGIFTSP